MKNYKNFINENSFHPKYNVDDKKVDEYTLETYFGDIEGQLEDYSFEWEPGFNSYSRGAIKEEYFKNIVKCFTKKFDEITELYYIEDIDLESFCGRTLLDFIENNKEYFDDGVDYKSKYDEDDDEEELREIVEPVKKVFGKYRFKEQYSYEEDDLEGFYRSDGRYLGSIAYNYFSEIYSDEDFFDHVFKNIEKYYNVKLDELIDFDKLKKLMIRDLTYENKYDWYIENVCDNETIREEIIDYDPKNGLVLFDECGEDICVDNYDFQKLLIEQVIKKLSEKEKEDFLPDFLKKINDTCGLDDKIAGEYPDFMWKVNTGKYQI